MAFKALSKSEKAYIQASLQAQSPLRGDGRSLHQFRAVTLQTGVVPIANGSAHLNLGRSSDESMGGTEILAAAKLEVEDISALGNSGGSNSGGRIVCSVSCSPAAYSYLSATALDDLQHDYSTILNDVLSHASLRPPNLGIIPGRKAWLLSLDLMVLSDAGNIYDALFMAARAALWDTRVPRTRAVEYRPDNKKGGGGKGGDEMDVDTEPQSGLDTRRAKAPAADFELEDSWDDGVVLGGRDAWPVSVTLNLFPGVHFLDATTQEEAATPLRLILIFSYPAGSPAALHGMHLLGTGDTGLAQIESLVKDGGKYALQMYTSLNANLKDEELRRTEKARLRFSAAR
ncbi:ribosomal protein S5 domain 2-like protein [Russula ochroleuca]|jgi:exosome complex component RRP42|uniref:Ribosomal RNA-processing protein 42 n=1 Tax=Russula ochroleuca TaxID=152965 RepID=A0A9P5K001_9AGAM|nr:ribosomal protein S5 domain 2-like protein [Russula ochroleuca]